MKVNFFFNYKIPYPSIITVEYDAIQTKQVTRNVQKKPYEFGVTYMDESTRSPEEELTLTSPSENYTVSNNIIATHFTPIVSTPDITIIARSSAVVLRVCAHFARRRAAHRA